MSKEREFNPVVLQTKQEVELAIKRNKIKNTKYNLLSNDEKLFVELVVFGDYTGEQAMRSMKPNIGNARLAANRMLANPEVAETIEELTTLKDKQFVSQLSSVQTMALAKLKYIMTTTKDEAIAAACAKTILDKATQMQKGKAKEDTAVTSVTYNIQVASLHEKPLTDYNKNDKIIIEADDEVEEKPTPQINEETGMPYVLQYEGVNLYKKSEDN